MSSILSLELIFALVMYGAGIITGAWIVGKLRRQNPVTTNRS
jgi:predicted MFS family arabinose efflux permease